MLWQSLCIHVCSCPAVSSRRCFLALIHSLGLLHSFHPETNSFKGGEFTFDHGFEVSVQGQLDLLFGSGMNITSTSYGLKLKCPHPPPAPRVVFYMDVPWQGTMLMNSGILRKWTTRDRTWMVTVQPRILNTLPHFSFPSSEQLPP